MNPEEDADWGEMSIDDGDDGGWGEDDGWGEEEAGDGFGEGEDGKGSDAKSSEEMVNGYIIIRNANERLRKEMLKMIGDTSEKLYVERGHAEILLRAFKWDTQTLEAAWFRTDDSAAELRDKYAIRARPEEWDDEDKVASSSLVRCTDYAGLGVDRSSAAKTLEFKAKRTRLYDSVLGLTRAKNSQQDIIRSLRGKFAIGDVIKMSQIVRGESAAAESTSGSASSSSEFICAARGGMFAPSDGARLNCGHWRCRTHWRALLQSKLGGNYGDCLNIACNKLTCDKQHQHKYILGCFCTERVPRKIWDKYMPEGSKEREKYDEATLYSFKEHAASLGLRPCLNPKCNIWYKKKSPQSITVSCECGTKMCFGCGLAPHQPIPCANMLDWNTRTSSDEQTRIWKLLNTAKCPNKACGVVINREINETDRCLHMICKRCKFHWCWACREEFRVSGPNKNHDNYYACKLYDEGKIAPEVKQTEALVEKIRREAQKLKFCEHLRLCCSRDSAALTRWRDDLQNKAEALPQRERARYAFIFDAIENLLQANEDKMKLYIVAFYAAMDNKKKLFEYQLKDMAEKTSKLQKILQPSARGKQRTLEELEKDSTKMKREVKIISGFLRNLRHDVSEGKCVTILDAPDDKSTGWFCMSCNRLNPFNKFVCRCTACKVHGEKRCLRCNPESGIHIRD